MASKLSALDEIKKKLNANSSDAKSKKKVAFEFKDKSAFSFDMLYQLSCMSVIAAAGNFDGKPGCEIPVRVANRDGHVTQHQRQRGDRLSAVGGKGTVQKADLSRLGNIPAQQHAVVGAGIKIVSFRVNRNGGEASRQRFVDPGTGRAPFFSAEQILFNQLMGDP